MTTIGLLLLLALAAPADDLPLADFDGETYGAWQATGEAFGPGPARGTLPGQMAVEGFRGKGLVNSFFKGDGSVGTLTSPAFTIERRYIRFLIGGGGWPERTCINLRIDGKIVRTATGGNTAAGGTERLDESGWDVAEYAGKSAVIQIVDNATGGWGHINVDDIAQTDTKPKIAPKRVTVSLTRRPTRRYLHLPIREADPVQTLTLTVDGKPVVTNTLKLATDGKPDWWAFVDVGAWKDRVVGVSVQGLPEGSDALDAIRESDAIPDADALYGEALRPLAHFSSRRGWLNDPNGLVFYNGEYHLFYQHNPYGWDWGNMHWGHATSRDLVHWTEHGDVLAPDALGPMFSGSAVVDWNNTSGFGKGGKPPLVLIYTAAGNPTTQCIAYSDDGRTFTKYAGNPVIPQITDGNRDPKVFWHAPTRRWVMALYVGLTGNLHTVHLFTSPDLKTWTKTSVANGSVGGDNYLFECPDLFPLAVDGDPKNVKWVLTAANSRYAIGAFDGTTFTPEHANLPDVRGAGFYAAQTFSDAPGGRRVQIGWLQAPSPGMSFNQAQSIPSELRLVTTEGGPRLARTPVREMASLRDGGDQSRRLADFQAEAVELRATVKPGDAEKATFTIRGVTIGFDAAKQEIAVGDRTAPAPFVRGAQRLIVVVDRTVVEVWASDGLTYVTLPVIPPADKRGVAVEASGGKGKLSSLQVYRLKSLWGARKGK